MFRTRVGYYLESRSEDSISFFRRLFFIFLGASLAAVSLQLFLVKNYVIDGGVIGISIVLSYITKQEVGLYLLLLNTPFFIIAYSFLGRRFLILSLFAILVLSVGTYLLEPVPALTSHPLFVILIGGITLGLGVGITIRFGGCLDGTEVLAILFSNRFPLSIGQCVLIFNFFIFSSSIFIFGIYQALYSLVTFLVAYKTIDFSIQSIAD